MKRSPHPAHPPFEHQPRDAPRGRNRGEPRRRSYREPGGSSGRGARRHGTRQGLRAPGRNLNHRDGGAEEAARGVPGSEGQDWGARGRRGGF